MTIQATNQVKARLASGEPCYIMAIRHSRTIDIVSMAQATGHHAFYVDLQHSTITTQIAAEMCLAGLAFGITPLVRIPGMNHAACEHLLEAGALGIIVPDVRTAEEAREVASWIRFPPAGGRSPLGVSAATRYLAPNQQTDREAITNETIAIVMLENEDGIAHADEIAAVPGIDALMIGSSDLTSSMGLHGKFEDPKLKALYVKAIEAARKHGKHLIIGGIRDPKVITQYAALGAAHCYISGTDTAFLLAGASAQIEKLRAIG